MRSHLLTFAAMPLLLGALQAGATQCAAGNPNTTSVAESTPTSAFVNNNDGTVTHTLTGLMWKQCNEGKSGVNTCSSGFDATLTWQAALAAAAADSTAGYVDWRLPNLKELATIVEYCGQTPAINAVVFPSTTSPFYFWSSTTDTASGLESHAWVVEFAGGSINHISKSGYQPVRLVRGGNVPDAFDARAASGCNLDIDGNGQIDALTDGLLFIRASFGLTGTSVTNGAIGNGATRADWVSVRAFMNANCGTSFAP